MWRYSALGAFGTGSLILAAVSLLYIVFSPSPVLGEQTQPVVVDPPTVTATETAPTAIGTEVTSPTPTPNGVPPTRTPTPDGGPQETPSPTPASSGVPPTRTPTSGGAPQSTPTSTPQAEPTDAPVAETPAGVEGETATPPPTQPPNGVPPTRTPTPDGVQQSTATSTPNRVPPTRTPTRGPEPTKPIVTETPEPRPTDGVIVDSTPIAPDTGGHDGRDRIEVRVLWPEKLKVNTEDFVSVYIDPNVKVERGTPTPTPGQDRNEHAAEATMTILGAENGTKLVGAYDGRYISCIKAELLYRKDGTLIDPPSEDTKKFGRDDQPLDVFLLELFVDRGRNSGDIALDVTVFAYWAENGHTFGKDSDRCVAFEGNVVETEIWSSEFPDFKIGLKTDSLVERTFGSKMFAGFFGLLGLTVTPLFLGMVYRDRRGRGPWVGPGRDRASGPDRTAGDQIMISYRRSDTLAWAGRLFDRLDREFNQDEVFLDIDSILPGDDFEKRIEDILAACEVLVAVIGTSWLTTTDEDGRRRLDDPEDYVRLELAAALRMDITVIPVLVDDADMPSSEALPPDLAALATRNAVSIGSHFERDVADLIRAINIHLARASATQD